jgi:tRNA (mo5U34)-methyltransferase
LFGIHIDTEWRSDWKWKRLQQSLPNLKDKVICDLGCGNGYFMYRMLEYNPKLVVGIDPNLHALLEFKLFSRVSGIDNIKFEYLRGDVMSSMIGAFDVVFCLGVLYHTNDPIGMLKDIHKSMKGKAVSLVNLDLFTSAPSSLSLHFLL